MIVLSSSNIFRDKKLDNAKSNNQKMNVIIIAGQFFSENKVSLLYHFCNNIKQEMLHILTTAVRQIIHMLLH